MGWELRWGGEGEEKVKGMREGRTVCMKTWTRHTHHACTHPHYTSPLTNESVHLVRVARVVRHKEGPTQDGKRLLSKGSGEEAQLVQQAAQGLREERGGEGRGGEGRGGKGRVGEGRGGKGRGGEGTIQCKP